MSRVFRSREKEVYWRGHLKDQSSSGESIRGYCRRRCLSEASFHFWRREIARRDGEDRLPHAHPAGLVAVEIVGGDSPLAAAPAVLEIECPGGLVIRVREEASTEVLQRVIATCRRTLADNSTEREEVRRC